MTYGLERRAVNMVFKPGLARYFNGATLELVEIPFGPLSDLSIEARLAARNPGHAILGQSLQIDGVPLGYEALRGLPGRLGGELSDLLVEAMGMHGMGPAASALGPEDEDDDDPDGDLARAPPNGQASGASEAAPGEPRSPA